MFKIYFKVRCEKAKREGSVSGSKINNSGSGFLRPNNFGSGRIRNTGENNDEDPEADPWTLDTDPDPSK